MGKLNAPQQWEGLQKKIQKCVDNKFEDGYDMILTSEKRRSLFHQISGSLMSKSSATADVAAASKGGLAACVACVASVFAARGGHFGASERNSFNNEFRNEHSWRNHERFNGHNFSGQSPEQAASKDQGERQ